MIETVAVTTIAASKLVGMGFCLGCGFYLSKKLTNKLDEVLLKYDKREIERLAKEMDICP